MGLFKNLRAVLGSRGSTQAVTQMDQVEAAGGLPTAEQMLQQVVGDAKVDPNDPAFAPFEGVNCDAYAHICKAIADAGPGVTKGQMDAAVQQHGGDPAKWTAIAEHWNNLVMSNDKVKMRYSAVFISES